MTLDVKNPAFHQLSHEGQVLLAAWSVLALSSPPDPREPMPVGYTRAVSELLKKSRPHYRQRQLATPNGKRKPRVKWRVTT